MVQNLLDSILSDLAEKIGIKQLKADSNNSCLIHFPDGLEIQIELDSQGEYLNLGADFGSIPSGPYRENLFREALRSNGLLTPKVGVFAFSQRSNHLVMHDKIRAKNINIHALTEFFNSFREKAAIWKEAILKNDIPVVESGSKKRVATGMFGLAP